MENSFIELLQKYPRNKEEIDFIEKRILIKASCPDICFEQIVSIINIKEKLEELKKENIIIKKLWDDLEIKDKFLYKNILKFGRKKGLIIYKEKYGESSTINYMYKKLIKKTDSLIKNYNKMMKYE